MSGVVVSESRDCRVVRALHPATTGAVLEVVDDVGARALIWPQPRSTRLPPSVCGVPEAHIRRLGLGAVRVEEVPPGALFSDLPSDLEDGPRAVALMGIQSALDALHSQGEAHGEVAPHRVWISAEGSVWLVGAGIEKGSFQDDLEAILRLVEGGSGGEAATHAADRLRLGAAASAAVAPVAPEARRIVLHPDVRPRAADMDEVGFDLGPDDARGLLDGWSRSGPTGELTGALSGDADRAHARLATLAATIAALDAAPADRHAGFEGQVPDGFLDRVRVERLDPLPMPDGLPPPALVAAKGDPLSEVTAIAAHPLYPVGVSTDGVDRRPPSGIVPERTVPRITSPDAEERTQTAEVTAQNRALGQSGSTARTETLTNRRALQALVVLFAVLFVAALLWGLGR